MKKVYFLKKLFYVLLLLSSVILLITGIGGFIYFFTNLEKDVLYFSILSGLFSVLFYAVSQIVKIND